MNNAKNKLIYYAGAIVLLIVAVALLYTALNKAQKRLALMESVHAEISSEKAALMAMSEDTKALKARAEESRNKNFVTEMEKTSAEFGLSRSLKKINFIANRQDGHFVADDYEIKLEGVDINTAVNYLHRLANAGLLVKVKKCSVAVSFENQNLLNISLLLSHLK